MRGVRAVMVALALAGCLAEADGRVSDGAALDAAATADAADARVFVADASTADAAVTGAAEAGVTGVDAGVAEVDCTAACARVGTDVGWARCYACQCKRAMDGWLPPVEALQCERGAPIVPYSASSTGALSPITDRRSACANPSLLYGVCAPGGTLGQLRHGDVSVKWICRRNAYVSPAVRDRTAISDMGAILHNERTGATCYFDDRDNVTAPIGGVPALDVSEASDADLERWLETFYNTDGEGCVACHAADPFVYTPYLASTGWITGAHPRGPYARVTLSGALAPVGVKHLVSPEAERCTSCHRLAEGLSCARFVRDSVGLDKLAAHEPAVRDPAAAPGEAWRWAAWMPSPQPYASFAAWAAETRVAREHILDCCSEAKMGRDTFHADGSPECIWRDVR